VPEDGIDVRGISAIADKALADEYGR
jgi:hypothetical protein